MSKYGGDLPLPINKVGPNLLKLGDRSANNFLAAGAMDTLQIDAKIPALDPEAQALYEYAEAEFLLICDALRRVDHKPAFSSSSRQAARDCADIAKSVFQRRPKDYPYQGSASKLMLFSERKADWLHTAYKTMIERRMESTGEPLKNYPNIVYVAKVAVREVVIGPPSQVINLTPLVRN